MNSLNDSIVKLNHTVEYVGAELGKTLVEVRVVVADENIKKTVENIEGITNNVEKKTAQLLKPVHWAVETGKLIGSIILRALLIK